MTEYRKDEYKKVRILFGFNEKLEKIFLYLFHTFFVAMTGHGKTLGMKSLLLRFHELFPDWKILIIDSKDKRDYADLNADIPICFVEATDPLDLKNLMEPVVGAKMMYYFDKIIEEATFDTLGEIQRNIHKKVVDADEGRIKIHGKDLGKLRVLDFTLAKLVALIEKPNIISELKLHDGFNVMPVSLPDVKNPNLKRAFQQLIARSALILLLADPRYERTLLVLDENHKWNPQRYSSICKQPLSEFISEGRSQDKIVWLSDQALTKIDKEALKNVKIWVVGQQMEDNEVEDARNAVNSITDLSVTDREIKTLKIGNFILVDGLHRTVEKVYLQAYGVPDDITQQIAKGADPELAEPYIFKFESKLRKNMEVDEDLVYKEQFEEEKRKREECEKEFARQLEHLTKKAREEASAEAMKKIEEIKKEWKVDEYQGTIANLKDEKATLETALKQLEPLKALKEALVNVFGTQAGPPGFEPRSSVPSEILVVTEQPTITIQKKKAPPLSLDDSSLEGKIAILYAEDELPRDKWFTVSDIYRAFQKHGWNQDPHTSKVLDKFCQWGYFTKQMSGRRPEYKIKLSANQAKEKGLLKETEAE